MIFVGIDPGKHGGITALSSGGVIFRACPKTEAGIPQLLRVVLAEHEDKEQVKVVMEKVGGYIGSFGNAGGLKGNPGSAMFTFGRNAGVWVGAMLAMGLTFEEVAPRTWQKGLGIIGRMKSESKVQWKARLKQEAQQRFPKLLVTLSTADSLLLASWCKMKHEGVT